MAKKNPGVGISLSFVCLLILGFMPIIANSRPNGFDALSFAFFLSLWQLVFSVPMLLRELMSGDKGTHKANLPAAIKHRTFAVVLLTSVIFGLSTYLYVLAVDRAGAVNAAIAIQVYPLFAILWETLFLKRKKMPLELVFTLLLLGALYYLATEGTLQIAGISIWFLLALGVPFLWSIAHVILKEVLDTTPVTPVQVTFFRVLISTILLLIVLSIVAGPGSVTREMGNFNFQKFALLMGLVYYIELINWFYAVRHIDVSVASSVTAPAPALTMVLAIFMLGESIALYQLVALGVVSLSIYGLLFAGKRRTKQSVVMNCIRHMKSAQHHIIP